MSAWGPGSFENDEAVEWAERLIVMARPRQEIVRVLRGVRDIGRGPVDIVDSRLATAAAEVVAALTGYPHEALPEELASWAAEQDSWTDPGVAELALAALKAVAARSELRETWSGPEDAAAWTQALTDLKERLSQ